MLIDGELPHAIKKYVEIPTDTAEREQKPSLAWIMPSRSRENPTLCRISLKTNAQNDV